MNSYLSKKISQEDREISLEVKDGCPDVLVFSGGIREMLEMKAAQFLYAEAEGNCVEVNYLSAVEACRKIQTGSKLPIKKEQCSQTLPLLLFRTF